MLPDWFGGMSFHDMRLLAKPCQLQRVQNFIPGYRKSKPIPSAAERLAAEPDRS